MFISCSATPAKYLLKRIRRGKFVTFDKLLLPILDETLVGQATKRTRDSRSEKRRVVDLATWLEAWNIFLAVRLQHPDIISSELSKEIAAGRVLGPFTEKPFVNLQTSGLGAAPKKNGKWCVILHLSAPYRVSVNDEISKEEFSLHYSTIDDTVRLLLMHGVGCLMAKVDLKSAFRMVPVRSTDWDLLVNVLAREQVNNSVLPLFNQTSQRKKLMEGLRHDHTLGTHDQLMLRAAMALAVFGFLRVGEFTTSTQRPPTQFLARKGYFIVEGPDEGIPPFFQNRPVGERKYDYHRA
ncbi:hypothetical protein EMCRGX_G002429 [Ephydatia muelleri]